VASALPDLDETDVGVVEGAEAGTVCFTFEDELGAECKCFDVSNDFDLDEEASVPIEFANGQLPPEESRSSRSRNASAPAFQERRDINGLKLNWAAPQPGFVWIQLSILSYVALTLGPVVSSLGI